MVGIWSQITDLTFFPDRSTDVAMATNFRVKMGEIGRLTFIRRFGIPKRSGISQFRFQRVHLHVKFGERRSSNSGV